MGKSVLQLSVPPLGRVCSTLACVAPAPGHECMFYMAASAPVRVCSTAYFSPGRVCSTAVCAALYVYSMLKND
jgi:hypothetical protein